ncbi:hypothetical protein [Candidatus Solirubrobacter pratensis]|jgi:hypothetical protein|uniref:hypothetical protein n=1 Tax=Candidatus Solirubrobacter pratensis TaxID=1298857 RepID=UPI0012DF732E|nr:hypothetical protein [Candidatus Solirubrobacter pratensis]
MTPHQPQPIHPPTSQIAEIEILQAERPVREAEPPQQQGRPSWDPDEGDFN